MSDHQLESSRIHKYQKISANRYVNEVNIGGEAEIDEELVNWLEQAYNIRRVVE